MTKTDIEKLVRKELDNLIYSNQLDEGEILDIQYLCYKVYNQALDDAGRNLRQDIDDSTVAEESILELKIN